MRKIDLTGRRFGKLSVIKEAANYNVKRGIAWECLCDCGNSSISLSYTLLNGNAKSCGCLRKETMRKISTKHGLSNTSPVFSIYGKIKERCYNKNCKAYKNYGGRGITMCYEWLSNFKYFHDWAIDNGYKQGLTIDRIDNEKGYEPANCRWVTNKTQQRNRRNNRRYYFKGSKKPLSEICEILGLDYHTVHQRISKYGWSFEEALTK